MVGVPGPFRSQVTFCYTADLEGSARFCEDVLGLELALDQGSCRIFRVAPQAYLGYCLRARPRDPDAVMITLVTEDVDAWHRRLLSAGVEFQTPPTRHSAYNIYHCVFRDPNGYLIEVQRFEDPRWRG